MSSKMTKVSAWAPAVGHIVDVSVVSVIAQLVMEDVSVCRACDSLEYLSQLSIVDLCEFLGEFVKNCLRVHKLKECASRAVFRPRPSCKIVPQTAPLNMSLGAVV